MVLRPCCSEQDRLRLQVLQEDSEDWQRGTQFPGLERVAGVDLSYIQGDHVNACAQLVVLSYPELEVRRRPELTCTSHLLTSVSARFNPRLVT